MGCVSTKKQTKDEDNCKDIKTEEAQPDKNGAVETTEEKKEEVVDETEKIDVQVTEDDEAGDDLSRFRKEALEVHNRQRALHGCPALELDSELNASAQKWAEHIAKLNALQHTPAADRKLDGETFGENLAYKNFSSSDMGAVDAYDPNADDIVMMWYKESEDPGYTYGDKNMQAGTGHFTQVVWKSSTRLGIGKVRVQNGNTVNVFVCGQYIPAGNFMGQFVENVPQLEQ